MWVSALPDVYVCVCVMEQSDHGTRGRPGRTLQHGAPASAPGEPAAGAASAFDSRVSLLLLIGLFSQVQKKWI